MRFTKLFARIIHILFLHLLLMQVNGQNSFEIIALGCGGGVDESNLSSYLISIPDENRFIALDAGTMMHGLKLAAEKGHFDKLVDSTLEVPAKVFLDHIDAYCISHPHLDHISGMLLAAPYDNHKTIMASSQTIKVLMDHIFLSPLWGNFTTENNPNGKWDLIRMAEDQWYQIPNNKLEIKYFSLCHSCPNESSAFLIKNQNHYLLYFGDTGSDEIENSDKLGKIFEKIAPLIQDHQLKAIFLESSFSNERNNEQLYGHLKPSLLEKELLSLAQIVNNKNPYLALLGIKIFVTHLKPDFKIKDSETDKIIKQIKQMNTFGAETIIIHQSDHYKI